MEDAYGKNIHVMIIAHLHGRGTKFSKFRPFMYVDEFILQFKKELPKNINHIYCIIFYIMSMIIQRSVPRYEIRL